MRFYAFISLSSSTRVLLDPFWSYLRSKSSSTPWFSQVSLCLSKFNCKNCTVFFSSPPAFLRTGISRNYSHPFDTFPEWCRDTRTSSLSSFFFHKRLIISSVRRALKLLLEGRKRRETKSEREEKKKIRTKDKEYDSLFDWETEEINEE